MESIVWSGTQEEYDKLSELEKYKYISFIIENNIEEFNLKSLNEKK